MRRKFLPLFLTCALLLNSSMAFAADVNEPAEGDALTTVSETQEEEVAAPAEGEQEVVTEEAKEASTPVVLDAEGNDDAAPEVITDFAAAYKALGTNGNPVSGAEVAKLHSETNWILDIRSTENTKLAHLDGSFCIPLFNEKGLIKSSADPLAVAFSEFATKIKNAPTENDIYVICNSGATGAQAATVLLAQAGIPLSRIHTVTNGAKDLELRYAMYEDGEAVTGEEAVAAVGTDNVVILDVRAASKYASGHLKGSISTPVFSDTGLASRDDDDLATAFKAIIAENAAKLAGKQIYVLCNSGQRGARAATALLAEEGYDPANIHTITGGATTDAINNAATYVSDTRVIEAINNGEKDVLVIDVRNTDLYAKGHLKGSLSLPVFDKDNKLPDDLAKAFTEYVAAHKADFDGKTIYVLCNSGNSGAKKAIELLTAAGLKDATLRTIEGGATSTLLQANFVTDTKPAATEPAKTTANNKTPKTGDAAPIMPLSLTMFGALCAIVAISKKKITK